MPFDVISNNLDNKDGNTPPYSEEALTWYEKNLPTLPSDYYKKPDFIFYEPLVHYLDAVNWSLFSLLQFKEILKGRWFRIPAGKKINRTSQGEWIWPIGSETAKLLGAKVQGLKGEEWQEIELRLARKIKNSPNFKENWAMAAYIKNKNGEWQIVIPPKLHLIIPRAFTATGHIRDVHYTLTAPQACMTCHSRGSSSPVDYKRGNEFVYGINDELLTGQTRVRLSQWIADRNTQAVSQEIRKSKEEDWIDIELKDLTEIKKYRALLKPIIEGDLPPLSR